MEVVTAMLAWALSSTCRNLSESNSLWGFCPRVDVVTELQGRLSAGAEIFLPGSNGYYQATNRWSTLDAPSARIVVVPSVEGDVSEIVKYANLRNIPYLAVNGGHGAITTVGKLRNGIEIRLSKLSSVEIAHDGTTAKIGGGTLSKTVIDSLWAQAKQTDSDLWWAMQGAGHNFGIVTSVTSKIYNVELPDWAYASFVFAGDKVEDLYGAINKHLLKDGQQPPVIMFFILQEGAKAVDPIYSRPFVDLGPLSTDTGSGSYVDLPAWTGNSNDAPPCKKAGLVNIRFPIDLMTYNVAAQRRAYELFATATHKTPALNGSLFLFEGYSLQGVKAIPSDQTAYPTRGHNLLVAPLITYAPDTQELDKTAAELGESLRLILHEGSGQKEMHTYVNYAFGGENASNCIVLINGIECYRDLPDTDDETETLNRKPAIVERFPGSEVVELNAFPEPEVRSILPMTDWISQSATEAVEVLEAASQKGPVYKPIVFIANNIGVALAKQILLLTFNRGNNYALARRTVAMFFAGYPGFNDAIHYRHHEGVVLELLLGRKQRLLSETFTEMLNTLPNVLYLLDIEFAAIDTRYCPIYLPSLPLNLESLSPELEQAFFETDHVLGSKHTQLLSTYESFLQRAREMASELRRPAPIRENLESTGWVLDHSTFRRWLDPSSSSILFINGPEGSGKTTLSLTIPHLLETQNRKLASDLASNQESKAAMQQALFRKLSEIASKRPGREGYFDGATHHPCFLNLNHFDATLRVALLESTDTQSTRASLTQTLEYVESIGSTDRVYELLLCNLENFSMAKEALNWAFHATRPLTVSELSVAIALSSIFKGDAGSKLEIPEGEDVTTLLEDNISWNLERDLQGIIGIAVQLVGTVDKVCIIDNSFRQYFESFKDLFIPEFHSRITQRCLAYISSASKHANCGSNGVKCPSRAHALLDYADQNWTEHYRLSVHPNTILDQEATAFLMGNEGLVWFERLQINAKNVLDAMDENPLVMAAERGLTHVVKGIRAALHPPLTKGWNSEVALQAAIWRGDLDIFEAILPMVLPYLEPTSLQRCLQLASEYGHTQHANIILSNLFVGHFEAFATSKDPPCLIAARNGHMETLTVLLNRLPEDAVLQTDSLSRTVIHWAAAWGDANALKNLNKRKGVREKILSTDRENTTALHLAAAAGSVEAVEFLLEVSRELIQMKDGNDLTALHIAAKEGHQAVLDTLIKFGADVWARSGDGKDAHCALELAAEAGHLPVVSLLANQMKRSFGERLEQNGNQTDSAYESDPSQPDGSDELNLYIHSSLSLAVRGGYSHIVRYILRECGEHISALGFRFIAQNYYNLSCNDTIKVFFSEGVNLAQEDGAGPLLLASTVIDGRADMVKYAVETLAGYSLDSPRVSFGDGGNIFHFAARRSHRAVMRELLQHPQAGVLLQNTDALGDKPLDTAAMKGQEGAVKELLRVIRARRRLFKSLFRAIEGRRISIVKLLLDHGWEAGFRDEEANTPFHCAVSNGQIEIAKLLAERSATNPFNEWNNAGDTSLHMAVSKKDKHMIRWLLDNGADPNFRSYGSGLSPVHLLCQSGGADTEEMVREFGSTEDGLSEITGERRIQTDFSLPTSDGTTAIHYAINLKDHGLIEALLEQRPNLNAEITETRVTPLMVAITEGLDIEGIKLLLRPEARADLNKRDCENISALDMGIDMEEWPIVKELVWAGANVNPRDIGDSPTPLYIVTSKLNLSMVEFLLENGADPHISGLEWLPPFELALAEGDDEIAKAILESDNFNIKMDSAPYSLGSHLHAALYMDQREIFNILVRKGANTERSAPPYGNPIHLAVSIDYSFDESQEFVEALVGIGADVNAKDLGGRTVLSLIVTEHQDSDISYLLDLNADPNVPDRLGATPLHYAAQDSSSHNLQRLIEKGGDVTSKDNCNRSVLHKAAGSGNHAKFMTVLKSLPEDCRNEHLASAIYPAIARRSGGIVKTILEETKIRLDGRDRNGWTVLEVAEAYGDEELISMLREQAEELESDEVYSGEKVKPTGWDPNDIGSRVQLFDDGIGGSVQGVIEPLTDVAPTTMRANACMCPDPETNIFYFEVTILQAAFVGVGFCEEYARLDKAVGVSEGSWGYHSDDGSAYGGDSRKRKTYGSSFSMKDGEAGKETVVGCGVDFRNKVAFFTLNGENQGYVFDNICGQLYPSVSLIPGTEESRVLVNFGQRPFLYKF
ncbi:hypothetical protein NUW58_g836 [Xylaria curta]|uniref:Uncharacterized protein n=1 Tax=Xylaria curta TaxID=42375 RepID=A0ACC1PMP8_9PEZI|nr:hypothetical protein NUW58_g836 [Xylaria curta]